MQLNINIQYVNFVFILPDTDEYRPPVWKSYCKYTNNFKLGGLLCFISDREIIRSLDRKIHFILYPLSKN